MTDTADNIHTYPDGIKVNLSVPATMTRAGLHYLGRMARAVPEGGTIVEVGPLYGSSTWVLAHNSHPSVKIWSLDTWEPQAWIPKRLPDAREFSIDAFKYYTRDCENVTAVQGWSPDSVADWDRPIDLFFDDATHGDPGFSANVNFFKPFVKADGILCGDDYASGWPDIIRVVNELAAGWEAKPEVSGRVWSVLNDGGRQGDLRFVSQKIGSWTDGGDMEVSISTANGVTHRAQPCMWAGALLNDDAITGFGLHPVQSGAVNGTIAVRLADGSTFEDLPFGKHHEFSQPVRNFKITLDDETRTRFAISYQGCEIQPKGKNGQNRTLNSPNSVNGTFLKKQPRTPLSAIRIDLTSAPEDPKDLEISVLKEQVSQLRDKLQVRNVLIEKLRGKVAL